MTLVPLSPQEPRLAVRGLEVAIGDDVIVSGVDFDVGPGEMVGLVGESGSGKTTIANALLGHARGTARIVAGNVTIDGVNLLSLDPGRLRAARGTLVAHVAQDPATALNPRLRIGAHIEEVLVAHHPGLDRARRAEAITAAMADVDLPGDRAFLDRFPHQLSGGQQQRVLLALAFILRPRLIVLDEPTTALDVTTQAQILSVIRRLCREQGISALYVSHDLAVVRTLVDRIVVLYAGRVVEAARRDALFEGPAHPYSRGLLAAIPDVGVRHVLRPIAGHAPAPSERGAGCAFTPRCPSSSALCLAQAPALSRFGGERLVACHHPVDAPAPLLEDRGETGVADASILLKVRALESQYGERRILSDIDFDLFRGQCTALVGESGSGKTTLARALVGLGESIAGSVEDDSGTWPIDTDARSPELRRRFQYVFQNPYRALNPRQSIGAILGAAIRHFFPVGQAEAERRAAQALARVSLPADVLHRRPGDLSGGERQRVAIARALVCEPELLICDEITSALDVSVQAAILGLLQSLQAEGVTILFVTHDLAVVRAIADRVIVLRSGRIVEQGPAPEILDQPQHAYTIKLLADSPRLDRNRAPAAQLVLA